MKAILKQTAFRGEITELIFEAEDKEYKARLPYGDFIRLDIKAGDEAGLVSKKNSDFILLEG